MENKKFSVGIIISCRIVLMCDFTENQMGDPSVIEQQDQEIAELVEEMEQEPFETTQEPSLECDETMPTEEELDQHTPCASVLDFIEMVWKGVITLKVINSFFLNLIMNRRVLLNPMMPQLRQMKAIVSSALQKITKHYHGRMSSIEDFEKFLHEQKLYTTFTSELMTEQDLQEWLRLFKKHITDQSSSSRNMETTSTSSTIVNTQGNNVDAPGCSSYNNMGGENALDELFAATTSQSNTGQISQTISRPVKGKLYSWKTPGENGYRLIKMDVYDVNDISNIDKKVFPIAIDAIKKSSKTFMYKKRDNYQTHIHVCHREICTQTSEHH